MFNKLIKVTTTCSTNWSKKHKYVQQTDQSNTNIVAQTVQSKHIYFPIIYTISVIPLFKFASLTCPKQKHWQNIDDLRAPYTFILYKIWVYVDNNFF